MTTGGVPLWQIIATVVSVGRIMMTKLIMPIVMMNDDDDLNHLSRLAAWCSSCCCCSSSSGEPTSSREMLPIDKKRNWYTIASDRILLMD